MNGFLMTMSLINQRSFIDKDGQPADPIVYKTDLGKDFTGHQTNEAPTKYVLYKLAREGRILDQIMILISSECEEKSFDFIGGKNTMQYFVDKMMEYFDGEFANEFPVLYNQIIDSYGDTKSYFNKIIMKVPVSSKPETDEKYDVFDSLIRFVSADDERNLYVDFSGGSRVSGMVLLTMIRVLEKHFDSKIQEVIYADINNAEKSVSDISDYYLSLKVLEDNAVAFKEEGGYSEYLEQLGMRRSGETEQANEYYKAINRGSRKAFDKKQRQAVAEKINEAAQVTYTDEVAKEMQKQMIKNAKKAAAETAFTKIARENDQELIKTFHEKIIEIMIDKGYIVPGETESYNFKEDVKKMLQANENYYEGSLNRKGQYSIHGVIPSVVEWLGKDVADYRKLFQTKTYMYDNAYKRYNPPYVVEMGGKYEISNFIKYIEKNKIYVEGADELEMLQEFARLSALYFNYGFPFMAKNKKFYPEITDYYYDRVQSFFNRLENYKNDPKYNINELLDDIRKNGINSELLRQQIPLMLKSSLWKVNDSKFMNNNEAKDFLQVLCDRIEEVRPYRNAIAHELNNEYSDYARQAEMAKQIREWLKEYEAICEK